MPLLAKLSHTDFCLLLSILIQNDKKRSWIFFCNNKDVQIEKSLFLGGNKVLNNQCIVIYGSTKNQNANIEWELKKSS